MSDTKTIECIECHNEFEANIINLSGVERPLSYYCPTCRNKKRQEYDELEQSAIESEQRAKREEWIRDCGIPPRFREKNFDTFIDRGNNTIKIMNICKEYAENFPLVKGVDYHSLHIFSKGVWGVGKTHLTCSIGKRIMERWHYVSKCPVYYTTESQMFLRIRSTFNRDYSRETENEIYEQLINIPLLIIDDVGKEEVDNPKFVQRVWFSIINGRYDNLLPVVITGNLDPDGMAEHLGGSRNNEATWDRLLEMLNCESWEIQGKSYRRNKVNELPDKTR